MGRTGPHASRKSGLGVEASSTRQIKDLTSAAQSVYSTRRAEDTKQDSRQAEEPELWPVGIGEMCLDLRTPMGRQLKEKFEEWEGLEASAWREEEYRRAIEERKRGRPSL